MNKIEKFIKDNKLTFKGSGSDLNSDCTIIAGYADFIGISDVNDIKDGILAAHGLAKGTEFMPELTRVFEFAYTYNYGKWWNSAEARASYKFKV